MMNSSTNDDAFGDNPFRTANDGGEVFFDSTATPPSNQPVQQFQQQPQFQQQQQQFPPPQQSFQPQPDLFAQPPPPPMGPMDNMAPQQQAGQLQMQPVSRTYWGNCMACLTLDSYRAYFDIDADDIVNRMKSSLMDFYKPEHFRMNVLGAQNTDGKGPDLYGPYWITMTLIFFIGVTSNMHDYLHRGDNVDEEFDYDINHLLHAGWIMCTFTFVLPFVIWVTTQCLNMQALLLVDWVCLYGYSLTPFVPAVILSVIPFGLISWICLFLAMMISGSLIVRNVLPPMLSSDVGQAKAPPLILAIMGAHVIFFLTVKYSFYHHKTRR